MAAAARKDGLRILGFAAVVLVLVGGAALLFPRWIDAAGGSDAQLATVLKETEPDHLEVEVRGFAGPLRSTRHAYARVSIPPTQGREEVRVTCTLDFTGTLERVQVSSLGLEVLHFVREEGDWKPRTGWAPTLAAVLGLLEARRVALEGGDTEGLKALVRREDGKDRALAEMLDASRIREWLQVKNRRYRVQRWLVRIEPEQIQVTEEGRLTGDLPDRPVDDPITQNLRIVPLNTEFFFSPTLM